MGLFGFDSKKTDASQRYTEQRATATEGSLIGYGQGATTVGGSLLKVERGGNLNVNESTLLNDPEVAITALKQQRKLSESFLERQKGTDDLFAQLLASQSQLAENVASGGEVQRNKTMLIVTLAVLVLVGWIFWKGG